MDTSRFSSGSAICTDVTGGPMPNVSSASNGWQRWDMNSGGRKQTCYATASMNFGPGEGGSSTASHTFSTVKTWRS